MSDDLIIKYLLKEASLEEEIQVKDWISSSPENQKEFSRFSLIWSTSKKLENESSLDTEKAWDSFKTKVALKHKVEIPVRSINRRFSWMKIAAVLFIFAGAWSFYSTFINGYETIQSQTLVRTEKLPDGSQVTLNRNTQLSYRKNFKGNIRSVKLESGEAFFNVNPDKSKPFIIEADDVIVEVVGTSFNVKHIEKFTEVIVETGIVQVRRGDQMIELKAGDKISVNDENTIFRKEPNTDQLYNYYRSNLFIADNTPLWRVVEILNEAYAVNIVFENETHRNLKLTTTFKDESLDNILHVITETFKITAVKENDRIVLK